MQRDPQGGGGPPRRARASRPQSSGVSPDDGEGGGKGAERVRKEDENSARAGRPSTAGGTPALLLLDLQVQRGPFLLQARGRGLNLPHHAQDVQSGEAFELRVGPAAADQLCEQR